MVEEGDVWQNAEVPSVAEPSGDSSSDSSSDTKPKTHISYFFLPQKPENTKDLKVGSLIAVMVEEGDDWQNAEIPAVAEPSGDSSSDSSSSDSSSSSDEEVTATMVTAGKVSAGAPVGKLHEEQLHQHGYDIFIYELHNEKTCFLHICEKRRRRSAPFFFAS